MKKASDISVGDVIVSLGKTLPGSERLGSVVTTRLQIGKHYFITDVKKDYNMHNSFWLFVQPENCWVFVNDEIIKYNDVELIPEQKYRQDLHDMLDENYDSGIELLKKFIQKTLKTLT